MQPDSNCSVSVQTQIFEDDKCLFNHDCFIKCHFLKCWVIDLTSDELHQTWQSRWRKLRPANTFARNGGMYHHFVANGYRVAKKVCLYGCLFARVFFSTREVCNKSCWKLRRSGPPWDQVRLCNLRSMTVGVADPALNDSGWSFGVSDRSFWGWTLLCLTFRNNGRFFLEAC